MMFRTPGRALLAGLALAAALAQHQRPAFQQDIVAYRAALSRPKDIEAERPAPPALLASAPKTEISDAADPFISPVPEPAFARLGAAVQPLVYRVEPGEEPLVPEAAPPEGVVEAADRLEIRPPPGHFLPIRWEEDTNAPAPSSPPARAPPQELARAAYAALGAGDPATAAHLFELALSARPSAQLAADLAYTRLRLGQRREAAAAFEAALRLGSATPEAGALWQQEASRLNDRVSLQAYTFLRGENGNGPSAAPFATGTPGQSQSALLLQVRPDPLARHPLLLVGRVLAAHHGPGGSPLLHSTQATAGIGWLAVPAVNGTVVAERWVKLGDGSRGAWALRAHGGHGAGYGPAANNSFWPHWSVFAEAAVIGAHRRDLYAGAEARAGYGLALSPRTRATITGALWGQVQQDDAARHRLEAGPSLGLETALGSLPLHLRLDYRVALSPAHAASGATLTAATGF